MSQTTTFSGRRRVRKVFGHIPEVAQMPNLIEVQKASYDQFLMVDEPEGGRSDEGLQAVFKSVFPITDFSGQAMLEFVKYEFEQPKFIDYNDLYDGWLYGGLIVILLALAFENTISLKVP